MTNFHDKHKKQDEKFKETVFKTIAELDAKFDKKLEKQIQTLSIQIKEDSTKFSSKLDTQENKISSFATSYDERLEKISSSNKVSTNI